MDQGAPPQAPASLAAEPPDPSDRRDRQRAAAAARMQRSRALRRDGMRVIAFPIRGTEIGELVRRGLLSADARHDRDAIARALGRLLDKIRW